MCDRIAKMGAQISTSLSAAEIDSAIKWRFSLENLWAANDGITSFMAAMGCLTST